MTVCFWRPHIFQIFDFKNFFDKKKKKPLKYSEHEQILHLHLTECQKSSSFISWSFISGLGVSLSQSQTRPSFVRSHFRLMFSKSWRNKYIVQSFYFYSDSSLSETECDSAKWQSVILVRAWLVLNPKFSLGSQINGDVGFVNELFFLNAFQRWARWLDLQVDVTPAFVQCVCSRLIS